MKKEERLHLYREMLRIRRFEEMVKDLFASMEILGSCLLYTSGQGNGGND